MTDGPRPIGSENLQIAHRLQRKTDQQASPGANAGTLGNPLSNGDQNVMIVTVSSLFSSVRRSPETTDNRPGLGSGVKKVADVAPETRTNHGSFETPLSTRQGFRRTGSDTSPPTTAGSDPTFDSASRLYQDNLGSQDKNANEALPNHVASAIEPLTSVAANFIGRSVPVHSGNTTLVIDSTAAATFSEPRPTLQSVVLPDGGRSASHANNYGISQTVNPKSFQGVVHDTDAEKTSSLGPLGARQQMARANGSTEPRLEGQSSTEWNTSRLWQTHRATQTIGVQEELEASGTSGFRGRSSFPSTELLTTGLVRQKDGAVLSEQAIAEKASINNRDVVLAAGELHQNIRSDVFQNKGAKAGAGEHSLIDFASDAVSRASFEPETDVPKHSADNKISGRSLNELTPLGSEGEGVSGVVSKTTARIQLSGSESARQSQTDAVSEPNTNKQAQSDDLGAQTRSYEAIAGLEQEASHHNIRSSLFQNKDAKAEAGEHSLINYASEAVSGASPGAGAEAEASKHSADIVISGHSSKELTFLSSLADGVPGVVSKRTGGIQLFGFKSARQSQTAAVSEPNTNKQAQGDSLGAERQTRSYEAIAGLEQEASHHNIRSSLFQNKDAKAGAGEHSLIDYASDAVSRASFEAEADVPKHSSDNKISGRSLNELTPLGSEGEGVPGVVSETTARIQLSGSESARQSQTDAVSEPNTNKQAQSDDLGAQTRSYEAIAVLEQEGLYQNIRTNVVQNKGAVAGAGEHLDSLGDGVPGIVSKKTSGIQLSGSASARQFGTDAGSEPKTNNEFLVNHRAEHQTRSYEAIAGLQPEVDKASVGNELSRWPATKLHQESEVLAPLPSHDSLKARASVTNMRFGKSDVTNVVSDNISGVSSVNVNHAAEQFQGHGTGEAGKAPSASIPFQASDQSELANVATLKVELDIGRSVRANVRERSGTVEVRMTTNDSQAARRLTGEAGDLRSSLGDSGLKLQHLEVSYQNNERQRRPDQKSDANSRRREHSDDDGEIFTVARNNQ